MITTTRKIYTQKIGESPYREVGGVPYKFVSGTKYEDSGELGQALDIKPIPNIKVWKRDTNGYYTVTNTYYNADTTSSITASTKTIVWKGQDLTSDVVTGVEIILQGTKFNDGKYTVVTAVYGANTTIVVEETMVADETVSAIEDGATLVTTATYYNVDDTSSITALTKTIVWKGQDLTATLGAADVFWLDNTASNDGTYTVDTITFGDGNTTIVVLEDTLVNETLDNADEAITFTTSNISYTNGDATSTIAANKGTLVIKGQDLTDHISNADDIILSGFDSVDNNSTFAVNSIVFGGGNTTIVIEDMMVTQAELGSVDIEKANETIVFTNSDATSSIVALTGVITLKGQDWTVYKAGIGLRLGYSIDLAGCTEGGNNATFIIDTIDYNITTPLATTITVTDPTGMVNEVLNGADETITVTGKTVTYTNTDPTSSLIFTDATILWKAADLTDHVSTGDSITLANCTQANNNDTFTVKTAIYGAPNTTITVEEQNVMATETLNGTDETLTIEGEELTYTNSDATSSATALTKTFVIKGQDLSAHILANDTFTIAGSEYNDGTFTVDTITFGGGNTTIVVDEIVVDEVFDRNPELISHDTN